MAGPEDSSDGLNGFSTHPENDQPPESLQPGDPTSEPCTELNATSSEQQQPTDSSPATDSTIYSLPLTELDGQKLPDLVKADPLVREVLSHLGSAHYPLSDTRHRAILWRWLKWRVSQIVQQNRLEFASSGLIWSILLAFGLSTIQTTGGKSLWQRSPQSFWRVMMTK